MNYILLVEPKRIALSRIKHCLQSSSNHYTLARPHFKFFGSQRRYRPCLTRVNSSVPTLASPLGSNHQDSLWQFCFMSEPPSDAFTQLNLFKLALQLRVFQSILSFPVKTSLHHSASSSSHPVLSCLTLCHQKKLSNFPGQC